MRIFIKMKINIGSKHPVKIEAVREAFSLYFDDLIVKEMDIKSGIDARPKRLEDIKEGARNRAVRCFSDCDYSVGIESGIFPDEDAQTGYMNISRCVIYDGEKIVGAGYSAGFEHLPDRIEKILDEGTDIGDKQKQGGVGILSKGKYPRKELLKSSIIMALLPIINKELCKEK